MRRPSTATGGFEAIRLWPSPEAKEWVRTLLKWAWKDPRVNVVVAIGSAVRPVKSSVDIDLVLAYDNPPPSFPSPPIDVDLRYFPAEQLRDLALSGHDLVGWAVKYGVPLIDKDGHWSDLIEEIGDDIPPPPPTTALRRAERAKRFLQQLVAARDEDGAHEQLLSFLTHLARARLASHGVYPASRPELPQQLRAVGEHQLARALKRAIDGEGSPIDALAAFDVELGALPRSS